MSPSVACQFSASTAYRTFLSTVRMWQAIHDWMLPLSKNIIRTLFHGVPESVVGKFVDTALVTAAGEMAMMRLRACSLSIAFMRKAPFCFYRPLPKMSPPPLIFGAGARYSLIQTLHLPMDALIELRCPLMFRHRWCLSARARVTRLNRITISRTSIPMSLATKSTEHCLSELLQV